MRGVSEAVQRMVDGLGLPSDIGNRGTSVNKRLDPNASFKPPSDLGTMIICTWLGIRQ